MLDKLSVDDFTPHIGQRFEVDQGKSPLLLELVSATVSRVRTPDVRTGFSLIFRGAPQPLLPQGVQSVVHPTLGALGIFLVPIGPDVQGMRYEAIFN